MMNDEMMNDIMVGEKKKRMKRADLGGNTKTGDGTTDTGVGGGDEGVGTVVDIEHGGVGTLDHDALAVGDGLVKEERAINDHAVDLLGPLEVLVSLSTNVHVELGVLALVVGDELFELGPERDGVLQVSQTNSIASNLAERFFFFFSIVS
jgi:hypothetical protein